MHSPHTYPLKVKGFQFQINIANEKNMKVDMVIILLTEILMHFPLQVF